MTEKQFAKLLKVIEKSAFSAYSPCDFNANRILETLHALERGIDAIGKKIYDDYKQDYNNAKEDARWES